MYLFRFRMCLCQSLKTVFHIQEYVKSKGVEIRFNGRGKNEASHYCGQCEVSCLIAFIYNRILSNNQINNYQYTFAT